ncbi:MAG: CoA-binding protein [Clostridia bacterium]|nr:MAG: CoA-binding protein [Clostridia bacterium]
MTIINSNIRKLLSPHSIAIVGATDKVHQLNGRFQYNLQKYGFRGKVFLVNPRYSQIGDQPCYPDVTNIPKEEEIDCAIILLRADQVPEALEKCAQRGIKGAIIFSGGFAEAGESGKRRNQQIREIIDKYGLAVCGPNCMGIINLPENVIAYGTLALPEDFRRGPMALISQSGGMGGLIFNRDHPLGISYVISAGNEAGLEIADFIQYLLDDPNVQAIACYAEGVKTPRKFKQVGDLALEKGKPIVVLKIGRSERGQQAAWAHTGSLTGSDSAYQALFRAKGVIRVDDMEDLFQITNLLANSRLATGDKLGIVSISGGAIGLVSDKTEELGLRLGEPSPETRAKLAELLELDTPDKVRNPVDVDGRIPARPELLRQSLEIMMDDGNFDAFIAIPIPLTLKSAAEVAQDLVELYRSSSKPLVVLWSAGPLAGEAFEILEEAGVPFFRDLDRGLKGVKALLEYSEFRRRWEAGKASALEPTPEVDRGLVDTILRGPAHVLTEAESKRLLSLYGIPVVREVPCQTVEAARDAARGLGYPVALKIDSPNIIHKTEAGGVRLGLCNDDELIEAYHAVLGGVRSYRPQAIINGVLVQPMVPPGVEVILGINYEPGLGPLVMFGAGGILTELLQDVAVRLAPITLEEAGEMIAETRISRLLQGFRGQPPADMQALTRILVRLSHLAVDLEGRVAELDINPLVVHDAGRGAVAVDALIVTQSNS